MHGLNGYAEVIDTIDWGLRELGHEVSRGLNEISPSARNIVFGGQMMTVEQQQRLPEDTIIYNFEQLRGLTRVRAEVAHFARASQVWDYSEFNIEFWQRFHPKYPVTLVPVGYAPILERIPRAAVQDIDVLIYGVPNEDRLALFGAIAKRGLSTVFVCGLYGAARDELIARSKVVVNLSLYTRSNVFEIVRVSYLLANRKAVACGITPETVMEKGVQSAVVLATPKDMLDNVERLVTDETYRREIEESGYRYFKTRDIRPILEQALRG